MNALEMNKKSLLIKFADDIKAMMRTEHSYELTRSLTILGRSNKMWLYAVKCKVIHLAAWKQAKVTDFILLKNGSEKDYSGKAIQHGLQR